MKLIAFQDPVRFQKQLSSFLTQHEAENNLILVILADLLAGEYQDPPPYLAAVEDGSKMVLALICTPSYPLLFSYREERPADQLVDLVGEELGKQFGSELRGMTGDRDLVLPFVRCWTETAGVGHELKMAMRIYQLDRVAPVTGVQGQLRNAQESDHELMQEWYEGFMREAMGEHPEQEQVNQQVERFLAGDPRQRGMVFWEIQGRSVSMAGYSGPTPNGIRIGAVYTPPEQRGNGYASACVAGLSQQQLNRGFKYCFLFTDLSNPTSNHIYQQIGYRQVSDVNTYYFR
ncbi:MAG: GNAT family N-acetyltransferase [Anaerolineales bacterium]|nr:GNAT family N-acetyltransferase [Anaerolineales bacterium]